MKFCGFCGSQVVGENARFCTNCGESLTPSGPYSTASVAAAAPELTGGAGRSAPTAEVLPSPTESVRALAQQAQASWPVPNKKVAVNGRVLPMDLVAVAGVNILGSLLMLVAMWPLVAELPRLFGNVFNSEPFIYAFSWMFFVVAITSVYIALAPAAAAYFLLRADPIGRDIELLFLGLLVLVAFSQVVDSGWFWLVFLVVLGCAAVLYISPWTKEALRDSERARSVPRPVLTARLFTAVLFSLIAVAVLVMLPGLRFVGELGASFVVLLALEAIAVVLAWSGYTALGRGRQSAPFGRTKLTGACLLVVLVAAIGAGSENGSFQSALPSILVAAGICALLWAPASSRAWFASSRPNATTPASA